MLVPPFNAAEWSSPNFGVQHFPAVVSLSPIVAINNKFITKAVEFLAASGWSVR